MHRMSVSVKEPHHYVRDPETGRKVRVPGPNPNKAKKAAKGRSNRGRSNYRRYPAASGGTAVVYPNVFRGSGGYYDSSFVRTMRKAIPEGSFSRAGSMVGGPLGGWAGGMLSKIAGFGDYSVSTNSLIGEGQSPAVMHSSSDVTVVRHREYIMDLVSSSTPNTFLNQTFNINPGLQSTFPWLAPIAQQFEQYTIKGMVFEFKTLFADAIASSQANSSVGGVIMSTDYNVLNNPFTTKQQMDNTQYTTSCKPSVSFYHPIECKPSSIPTNQLYVRSGNPPNGGDLRLFDLGQTQIASFGIAASSVVLGELWCTYEIEFSKPISKGATANVLSDHYQLLSASAAAPLGVNSTLVDGSSIGGTIVNGGPVQVYNFPAEIQEGTYLFVWSVIGTSTASLNTPAITTSNCSALSVWNGDSSSLITTPPGNTSARAFMAFVIQINAPGAANPASVQFDNSGTLPASITSGDLFVTEIDSDIVS